METLKKQPKNYYDQLKELIGNGKIKECLNKLNELLRSQPKENEDITFLINEIFLIKSRLRYIERDKRRGIVNNIQTDLNKIITAVLVLIDLIEEELNQSEIAMQFDGVGIVLNIPRDFDTFSDTDLNKIMAKIKKRLKANQDNLRFIRKERGSVKLKLKISLKVLAQLKALESAGELKGIGKIEKANDNREKYIDIRNKLFGLYLNKIDLSMANLKEANFYGADLNSADFGGADFSKTMPYKADFSRANLRYSNFNITNLTGVRFSGADLTGADLIGVNLTGADLSYANLSGAYLSGANLSGADLSGANLSGADLSKANFNRTNLNEVNFNSADLRHSFVNPDQLKNCILDHTIFHISKKGALIKAGIKIEKIIFQGDDGRHIAKNVFVTER